MRTDVLLAAFIVAVFTAYVVGPLVFKSLEVTGNAINPATRLDKAEQFALGNSR